MENKRENVAIKRKRENGKGSSKEEERKQINVNTEDIMTALFAITGDNFLQFKYLPFHTFSLYKMYTCLDLCLFYTAN